MSTSRTRSRVNTSVSYPATLRSVDYSPGSISSPPPLSFERLYFNNGHNLDQETCKDVVTKNYKKLSAKGYIFNNPFEKIRTISYDPLVQFDIEGRIENYSTTAKSWYTYAIKRHTGTSSMSSLIGSFPSVTELNHEALIGNAVNGAWANAQQSKVLALVTAAEFPKSVASLIGVMRRVINLSRIMSGKKKPNMTRKDLEDFYLECRYAYRPMFFEVNGIIKALQTTVGKKMRQTFRSSGANSHTETVTIPKVHALQTNVYWIEYNVNFHTFQDISVQCGILTDIEISLAALLGLDTIVESTIELVPYSFILNWFFTVSQTVAAWTPNIGVKTLASWLTEKITVIQSSTITDIVAKKAADTSSRRYYISGGFIIDGFAFKSTFKTIRNPNPRREIFPRFNVDLDALKLLDLVLIGKKFLH